MKTADLSDVLLMTPQKTNWSDFWLGVTVITCACTGVVAMAFQLWT